VLGEKGLKPIVPALLAACGIVLWTCLPVLEHPQLEPDDYRYLALVTEFQLGRVPFLTAAVVENRWDHLWWVDTAASVRFFRPTLFLSFLADDLVHGSSPAGLLTTNLLLHLACCVLATLLAFRFAGGIGATLASALFAAFSCHAETIWYVSGRNETLAALGFLAALLLHVQGRRWLALPCFAFALCAKELTVALPVLLWLHDRWLGRRQGAPSAGAGIWVAHAALCAAFFVVRRLALGTAAVELVYPYLVSPTRPDFLAHVWGQVRNYAENLLFARPTPPFLRPDQVPLYTSAWGLAASAAVLGAATLVLRKERRFWLLAASAVLTWLPTSFVYVSERYLYLPSFAVAMAAGLAVERSLGWRWLATFRVSVASVAIAGALCWTLDQALALRSKNAGIMSVPREAEALARILAGVAEPVARTHRVLLVNLPAGLLGAQFVESQLRSVLRDPDLVCRVLTVMPWHGAGKGSIGFAREGQNALELHGTPVLMAQDAMLFPWRRLEKGSTAGGPRLGFRVEVADGNGAACSTIAFTLERPVEAWTIVTFVPPEGIEVPAPSLLRGQYILAGRMQVIR
jgi:hypothetical protein